MQVKSSKKKVLEKSMVKKSEDVWPTHLEMGQVTKIPSLTNIVDKKIRESKKFNKSNSNGSTLLFELSRVQIN